MKYSKDDFQELKKVGALTSECLLFLGEQIEEGIRTEDIDDLVKAYAIKYNLICATKGYRGFPANCCTSVNHVACHGIPSRNKVLKKGDIISVDVTFINENGYYGDSCYTYGIDNLSRKAEITRSVAKKALEAGLNAVTPEAHIGHIGYEIQNYIEKQTACSIIEDLIGHGTGKSFHESPKYSTYL